MATRSSPVKLVDSILKYVHHRASAMTGDALTRLVDSQCQSCVLHLRTASLSYDDGQAILSLLNSSTCLFTTDQIAQVSAVVDQKLTQLAPCSGVHDPHTASRGSLMQQTHKHLRHYLTDMLWATINSHIHMNSKLEQVAQYFVNVLLLRNPSEPTRSDMVAIIRVATHDQSPPEEVHAHMLRCDTCI